VTSEFDGDVFGNGAKEIRQIQSTIQLGDPTATVVSETAAFGQVSARLDANLQLVLTAGDVPGATVASFELVGSLRADRTGFDATYHVAFEDGTAADGTISVVCSTKNQRPNEVRTLCTPPA
jgi:hypothetical protein